jgi:predicted CoA-binding protein
MATIKQAASDFLSNKGVAVTGVSRTPGSHGSNVVYKRLRERGYDVFAVNPNADEVEGDRAYNDLRSIPDGAEAVVIGTRPETADETMRECAELGIKHVCGCTAAPARAESPRPQRPTAASTESPSSTAVAPACSGRPRTPVTRRCASCSP